MVRSHIVPVDPARVPRRERARWRYTFLALTTALAFAAPLAHAHVDAANAAAHGICGDHLPSGETPAPADACPVCLAGAHAPAVQLAATSAPVAPTRPAPSLHPATPALAGEPEHSPGAPRAPPASA